MAKGTVDAVDATERMVVTRDFNAPRELVWKAYTEAQYVAQWWGPKGCSARVSRLDFRVDGKFLICMELPDGQEFWSGGQYHEIVPQERIAFSLYFADAQGNKIDPSEVGIEHESIDGAHDVVTFEDLGNGRTRLTHTGNEPMESALSSGQVEGMNQSLDKFEAVVAGLTKPH